MSQSAKKAVRRRVPGCTCVFEKLSGQLWAVYRELSIAEARPRWRGRRRAKVQLIGKLLEQALNTCL